jgi:hypothetical protein
MRGRFDVADGLDAFFDPKRGDHLATNGHHDAVAGEVSWRPYVCVLVAGITLKLVIGAPGTNEAFFATEESLQRNIKN